MPIKDSNKRKILLRDIKRKKFSKSVKENIKKEAPKLKVYAENYGKWATEKNKSEKKSLTDWEKQKLKKTRSKSKGNFAKRVLKEAKQRGLTKKKK